LVPVLVSFAADNRCLFGC